MVARMSMLEPINLDANANVRAPADVIEAVVAAMKTGANASSGHSAGGEARAILAQARDAVVAMTAGVYDDGVVFTSGCTEANNLALASVFAEDATLVVSSVEHPSILAPAAALEARGVKVHRLPVDKDGLVRVEVLSELMRATAGPVFVSIQTANSETGVLQPIDEIANLIRNHPSATFHTDAAQSFGKRTTRLGIESGPHMASMSGHKLHAPMGIGALLLADGYDRVTPLIHGGDQEQGRRAGTEAIPLAAGLAAACRMRSTQMDRDVAAMGELRARLEEGILNSLRGVSVNGVDAPRLPNTTSIRFHSRDAMAMVARLDAAGVFASQGSACSSMRPTPSHVLLAMGRTETEAFETVRFSVSPLNTTDEIDEALAIIVEIANAWSPVT
jgi:cysteine desulfurase